MQQLFSLIAARAPRTLALIVGLSVLGGYGSIAIVARIARALRTETGSRSGVGSIALMCLAVVVAVLVTRALIASVVGHALVDLRMDLARALFVTPLRRLEQEGPARIAGILDETVDAIAASLRIVPIAATEIALVVVGCVRLAWLSPAAAGLLLCVLVAGLAAWLPLLARARRMSHALARDAMVLHEQIEGVTLGTKELKLSAARRARFFTALYEPAVHTLRDRRAAMVRLESYNSVGGQAVFYLLLGATVFGGVRLHFASRAMLAEYVFTLLAIGAPFFGLLNALPRLLHGVGALHVVTGLGLSLAGWRETTDGAGDTTSERAGGWSSIALEGVRYLYEGVDGGRRFAVGPIDLRLEPGRVLFVVGGNGSGKSTLVKLLVGLYTPTHGRITVDGAAVTAASCARYRERFAVVFADAHVFATLPDGEGEAAAERDARARVALARLGLEGTVTLEHGVLSTTRALSTGQRKRLALALACLEERDVYVFDEWAADQDPASREAFYTHLLPELRARGKAVVVVTHDEAYFHLADVRVQLGDGRIVATRDAPSASVSVAVDGP